MTPLDPMFNNQPVSMWDVLADGLASQGLTPQTMMSYADVLPNPRRPGTGTIGRPNMGPPPEQVQPDGSPYPAQNQQPQKAQERAPQTPPPQEPPPPPTAPSGNGSPLDPQPAAQPEPYPVMQPPGSPLDIRPPAQIGPPAAPPRSSEQLALAGLKAMQPEKAYIPPPPSIPRPDTGGLARVDPVTIMKNMQTGGPVPLLLLSQLLGRG